MLSEHSEEDSSHVSAMLICHVDELLKLRINSLFTKLLVIGYPKPISGKIISENNLTFENAVSQNK